MNHKIVSRRASAQVMVFFTLALVGLLGLVALVVDGGYMYVQRRTAQEAADAAALAGTAELSWASGASNVSVGTMVCKYAQGNAFGITPSIINAYFVDGNGNKLSGADITLPTACGGSGGATSIPWGSGGANGVHVDLSIPFQTFLARILGVVNITAMGSATANVGIVTAGDVRNAPFIVCGGGTGSAERIGDITTPLVVTTTPQVLGSTPAALPTISNNGPPITPEIILATPASGQPTQPAYYVNPAMDGQAFYIKGQNLGHNGNGGNCGLTGFDGGANPTQTPTDNWINLGSGTPVVMVDQQGNKVPQINGLASAPGACAQGTDPNTWISGTPGCVMWLPIANNGSGQLLDVMAWGAFYVWCGRNSAGQCQEFGAQLLANWKGSGPSVNAWQAGRGGGSVTIHLSQ